MLVWIRRSYHIGCGWRRLGPHFPLGNLGMGFQKRRRIVDVRLFKVLPKCCVSRQSNPNVPLGCWDWPYSVSTVLCRNSWGRALRATPHKGEGWCLLSGRFPRWC